MDRQVAYELFTRNLKQRNLQGIDLKKELPELLAWGYAKGCFANPHTVHDLEEWRKLGNLLWEAVIDDDKTARKLSKLWRAVHNEMLQQVAEKKAAGQAVEAHKRNMQYGQHEGQPLAPATRTVIIPSTAPSGASGCPDDSAWPSAPILEEQDSEGLGGGEELSRPSPRAPAQPCCPPATPDPALRPREDSREGLVRQRKEAWRSLAQQAMVDGDGGLLEASGYMAFPALYTPVVDAQGEAAGLHGEFRPLDWKMLAQLRQTVSQFGFKSEPVWQMLDYIFDTEVLLPNDLRGISRLMLTEHQMILFGAHWQALANESAKTQRQPGDPLHGISLDELMGIGNYTRTEAQLLMGPDKAREAMRVFRSALDRVKEPGGAPPYMAIKQGRDEPFGTFIDRVCSAIDRAGAPSWMKGTLLKQCAIQNSSANIQRLISTLPGDWGIEELLERAAMLPAGQQAFLVEAIKELGAGLQKQAEATQSQVLAALAALQASAATSSPHKNAAAKCYRCGKGGHIRRACRATGVWCQTCQSDSHNTAACRRKSGNRKKSAPGCAKTQVAGGRAAAPPPASNPQPQGPSAWTWQQQ
ncbi:GAK24 protein, partial [Cercotrichas coryphoeus]|nr:GAK24 protein [Cercotrichas coryphoeus]